MKTYILGIGGVAMGNLASLLKAAGHEIVGVDAQVYPPISDFLKEKQISYQIGFDAKHITSDIDLAVIGNVVSANNVELASIKELKIPMLSLPQTIQKYLLPGAESVVIAGTHGKTTTTALMTNCLYAASHRPGFLLGGIANNFATGSDLGDSQAKPRYFVLEGDEYDSAYFQKEPKFLSYQPKHLIITSLEFDHADIYPNLAAIQDQFTKLVKLVPSNGEILVCSQYPAAIECTKLATAKVYTYGKNPKDHFQLKEIKPQTPQRTEFLFHSHVHHRDFHFWVPLIGEFNVLNALAVSGMSLLLGMESSKLQMGLASFTGVRRRQQQLFSNDQFTIIEDFAHHPTAIRVTLEALRTAYVDHEIWAIFEPRSNTTRRNYFQESLPEALAVADKIIFYKVYNANAIAEDQRLNRDKIGEKLRQLGKECYLPDSVEEIVHEIASLKPLKTGRKRLLLIMTNGDFDGLKPKLIERLSKAC